MSKPFTMEFSYRQSVELLALIEGRIAELYISKSYAASEAERETYHARIKTMEELREGFGVVS